MSNKPTCLAVIRIRGQVDMSPDVRTTLELLHLTRNCHITLVDNRASFLGMLKRVRNFVTWGEITQETLLLLLKERGRLTGNKTLSDDYAQRIGYKNLDELATAVYNQKVEFQRLPDIKPVFRAHPPKKGYKGKIKKSYTGGGVTGYRGEAVNELIRKMV
jgi:large subunit ribosomal protein L30